MEYNNPFMLSKIKYVKGNVATPVTSDYISIMILVSDDGEFRNQDIESRYPKAKDLYRSWWRQQLGFKLGCYQINRISSTTELSIFIVYTTVDGKVKLDMKALEKTFDDFGREMVINKRNVHLKKFGTKKEWKEIEKIITEKLSKRAIPVYIYED
jgi:transcriptional regulator of heat shock response